MKARVSTASALIALSFAIGCGGEKTADGKYFGKVIAPPGELAKIKKGMTIAEAQKLVPSIKLDKERGDYMVASGYDNLKIEVSFRKDVVDNVIYKFKGKGAEKFIVGAWGPGKVGKYDKESQQWQDDKTGFKARLSCSKNCYVYFENYTPLTQDFFGKEVAPLSVLANVKVGMTEAQVLAAVPQFPEIVSSLVNAGPDEVMMSVYVPKSSGVVQSTRMTLPPGAMDMLVKAWGPPVEFTSAIKQELKVWFNPKTGVRAVAEADKILDQTSIVFDTYLPYTQMLGDDKDTIAFLPKPMLDLTADELKAAYAANLAKEAGDDVRLSFPPTDFGRFETRVNFFIYEGKTKNVRFSIPYEGRDSNKAEILAFMKKKWGEPTVATDYDKSLIFRTAAPVIKVKDDTISNAWDVTLTSTLD